MDSATVGLDAYAGRFRPELSAVVTRVAACQVDETLSLPDMLAQATERRISLQTLGLRAL